MLKKYTEEIERVLEPVGDRGGALHQQCGSCRESKDSEKQFGFDVGLGIQAVLTVARGHRLAHDKEVVSRYLYLPVDDHEQFNIGDFFEKSNKFISENLSATNVLVHCVAGISRSASVILAFLMSQYGMKLKGALSLLKNRRAKVQPNRGFLRQLIQFERRLQNSGDIKHAKFFIEKQEYSSVTAKQKEQQLQQSQDVKFSKGLLQSNDRPSPQRKPSASYHRTMDMRVSLHYSQEPSIDNTKFEDMRRELDSLKENIKQLKYKFNQLKKNNGGTMNSTLSAFSRRTVPRESYRPVQFRT